MLTMGPLEDFNMFQVNSAIYAREKSEKRRESLKDQGPRDKIGTIL